MNRLVTCILLSFCCGCAFYDTYPVYEGNARTTNVPSVGLEFSGQLFKQSLRGDGRTMGVSYGNTYVANTHTTMEECSDPNANVFKNRLESLGYLIRSPNPKYLIDVSAENHGEQARGERALCYLCSLSLLGKTEILYIPWLRVYEKDTGKLICNYRPKKQGYTLRLCGPLFGAFVDRYFDVPASRTETSWIEELADHAADAIADYELKKGE